MESTEIIDDAKEKFNDLFSMNLPEAATCSVICRKRRQPLFPKDRDQTALMQSKTMYLLHCARTDQCPAVNCNCLPTKNLRVLKNSLKRVRAFQIELKFGSVGFYGEGKTGVTGGKANVMNCRSCPHTELQSLWAALQIESSC